MFRINGLGQFPVKTLRNTIGNSGLLIFEIDRFGCFLFSLLLFVLTRLARCLLRLLLGTTIDNVLLLLRFTFLLRFLRSLALPEYRTAIFSCLGLG